jgi:hypothetical protein
MPYTNRSAVVIWLIVFGLFFLAGSGVVTSWWLFLMLPAALAAPAFILRIPAAATTTS